MFFFYTLLVVLLLATAFFGWQLNRVLLAGQVERALASADDVEDAGDNQSPRLERPFVAHWKWIPFFLAFVAGCLALIAGLRWPYAAAIAVWAGVLAYQIDSIRRMRVAAKIELQLARALDFMISALRAGASLPVALDSVTESAREPLATQLTDVTTRLKLGEEPQQVFSSLFERVPLETFNLFSTAMTIQYELGGSITQALTSVSRTIRDRIQIRKRLDATTIQARLSVTAITLVTYGIFALMFVSDPEYTGGFLRNAYGQIFVSVGLILQAVGIMVIAHLSRPRA